MKSFFTLSLFLLSFSTLLSQDWLPFLPGQISYYRIKDYYVHLKTYNDVNGITKYNLLNTKDRIIAIETDNSIVHYDEYSTYHLINQLKAVANYKCYDQIMEKKNMEPSNYCLFIDSFQVFKDKFIMFEMKRNTNKYFKLEIPLFSAIGDSIINDDYSITYKTIENQEIFPSIFDSVKTFSIIYKYPIKEMCLFKLSKNYGIIYYEVIDQFKNITETGRVPLELIGIKEKEKIYGITAPNTHDVNNFFSLHIGDLKYWVYWYTKDSYFFDAVKLFKDSLVEINQNEEKISFKFDRYEFDEGKVQKVTIYENYEKERLQTILDNPTSSIYIMKVPFNTNDGFDSNDRLAISGNYVLFDEKLNDNKNWGYSFISHDELTYPDSCNFSGAIDSKIRLFPEIGLIFQSIIGDFGGFAQNLIGYSINNTIYGDFLPIYTSVEDNITNNSILSPNPATDYINLNNLPDGAVSYEIFDIFGERVLSTPSLRDTPQEVNWEIDVSSLPTGVYFLKLNNQPPVKFIKI